MSESNHPVIVAAGVSKRAIAEVVAVALEGRAWSQRRRCSSVVSLEEDNDDVDDDDVDVEDDWVLAQSSSSSNTNDAARLSPRHVRGLVARLLREDHHQAEAAVDRLLEMKLHESANRHVVRAAFDDTNICEYLIQFMNRPGHHPQSVRLQSKCCGLLANLTFRHEANTWKCHAVGACTRIVHAMTRFPRHLELQRCACAALRNLSWYESHHHPVIAAGGIEAVIHALSEFPENDDIQTFGCRVLQRLITNKNGSSESRTAVVTKGGVVALAQAYERSYQRGDPCESVAAEALHDLFGN